MTTDTAEDIRTCGECGASNRWPVTQCWLCHGDLEADNIVLAEVVSEPPAFVTTRGRSFSLASIFIVITLVAVGLGLSLVAPGMGFLFAIVALPALIGTMVRIKKQQLEGGPIGWSDKLTMFLLSTAVTVATIAVLCVAAFIALFVFCWVILLSHAF